MPQCSTPFIRPASTAEIEEIVSITLAAFVEYRSQIPKAIFEAYANDVRNLANVWEEAVVLVAELEGQLAGTIVFYANARGLPRGWAGFRRLAVNPPMRGLGIGQRLTAECVAIADALDAPTIGLHTPPFLQPACNIYDKFGFRRCHEYDVSASKAWSVESCLGDFNMIAYRMDLPLPRA